MQTATKKPVQIHFVIYNGVNHKEVIDFTNDTAIYRSSVGSSDDGKGGLQSYSSLKIPTLEGEMWVSEGDYVIKGVKGEFYPCKPDIFLASYNID